MSLDISAEELADRWERNQFQIEAFILSLVPDFHQASDILQNVALVVVRKGAEYDASRPFAPWAIRIAKYEVLKHQRSRARDRHLFQISLIDQIAESHLRNFDDVPDRRKLVAECVGHISGKARKAILLRYVDSLKPSQIAKQLAVGGSATRMILLRARQFIRKCIERGLSKEG